MALEDWAGDGLDRAAVGAQSCGCPAVLCARLTSPLTAALPLHHPRQEKRGTAESSENLQGKQGQAVPAPRSFPRHRLRGAEHLTVPQLSANNPACPPPSSQHEAAAAFSSSGTLGQHDSLKCVL